MATIPVVIQLQKLFCYHGADEGDSEPYLWTVGFTVDGRTITHTPGAAKLTGAPAFFFSPGSHGSLGGPMGIGANRIIPDAVGRFATTLQPIVIHAAGLSVEVPGRIGLVAVLLEENATSAAGAEAAHRAINDLVRIELSDAVADINMIGLAAEIQHAVSAGQSIQEAANTAFTARSDRVVERIRRFAESAAIAAIVEQLSFPSALVEAADPDEFMGLATHFFSQGELEATHHTARLQFTDRIAQPGVAHLESSDYVYNLHGAAWQPVEVFWTPVTDEVPPGRWQVTGIAREGGLNPFISHLGGQFANGTPWALPKGTMMRLIRAQSHTFFVRGSSGQEAEILIDSNEQNPHFPFLTTTPDSDPTNNLSSLPLCPLSIRHTRPVSS